MKREVAAQYAIIFIGIVLFVLTLRELASFLRPLAFAIITAMLIVPFQRTMKRSTFILLLLLSIILLGGLGFFIARQIPSPSVIGPFFSQTPDVLGGFIKGEEINSVVRTVVQNILGAIGTIFSESLLVLLFFGFIYTSYVPTMNMISAHSRSPQRFFRTLTQIEKDISAYVVTKVVISFATAVASALVLLPFTQRYVLLYALLVFMLNFIPNIGSIISVALVLLGVYFSLGFSTSFFIAAALFIVVQFIFGNIIETKYTGDRLRLSPLIILLSLLFWGWVWGIVGMLLAVPLTSILKIILADMKSTASIAKAME